MATPKENIEMINDLGTKGYEAAKSLGEINVRIIERMMARQMDAFSILMESSLRNIRTVSEAKAPSDVIRGQVDMMREVSERLLTEGRETVKLAGDTRDEYRAWFEQGMQVLGDKFGKLRPLA